MTRMKHFYLAAAAAMLAPLPAYGQVIEIDAAGDATTYDGPTMFTTTESISLRPEQLSSTVSISAQGDPVAMLEQAARIHRLDPSLLKAVAWQESRGRMAAVSSKGARGVMQLMPATALELGVDPRSLTGNIHGGALYLRRQIDRFGSVPLALAAYNAGPGAVLRFGGIPPYRETRDYVSKIMGRWKPIPMPNNIKSIIVEVVK